MNRQLVKESVCPCGKNKKIIWMEPLLFCMGFEDSCVGYSVCTDCDILQTHYSGSVEGAIEFQNFLSFQDFKSANDNNFH